MFEHSGYKILPRERMGYDYFAPIGAWRNHYAGIMRRKGINCIRLSQSFKWHENSIDFLTQFNDLKGLDIYNWELKDALPIANLSNLEALSISCCSRYPLDIENLKKLKYLCFHSKSKVKNYENCHNIIELNIDGFPLENLLSLRNLSKIEKLSLSSRNITSLTGVNHFSKLQEIEISYCTNLKNISDLDSCPNLKTIHIHACRSIRELPMRLGELPLESVFLNNMGNISSLVPLKGATQLKTLWFIEKTNIEDGNLKWLIDMPNLTEIRFMNRKHYDIKRNLYSDKIISI